MKILCHLIFSILAIQNLNAQSQISGRYVEIPSQKNSFYGSKLILNCNHTFFRNDSAYQKDSAILCYGTWKILKDSQLILHIDSVLAWGNTDFPNVNLKLKFVNGQIFNQSVSKKDYNNLVQGRNKKRGYNVESFEAFKERELSRFFAVVNYFKCE